jgi:hypothetical protein
VPHGGSGRRVGYGSYGSVSPRLVFGRALSIGRQQFECVGEQKWPCGVFGWIIRSEVEDTRWRERFLTKWLAIR